MLSLLGSLQPDPFSPLHTIAHEHVAEEQAGSDSEDGRGGSDSDSSDDDDSEGDTLQLLGKRKAVVDIASQNITRPKT